MDGRLHDLLRKQTQRADETAKRAIEDGAKSLKPGSLLNRARKRTGEKVAKGFRAEADAAYADVKRELDRIADAAADETARKIEALTGKPAKAARGAVDGRQLRADLRRSNASRAKNAERALGRAVKGTPPGKRDAAASEAAKSAWKDVAKSRQRKRFVDSRGRAWKDSVYNEMRAKTMEANAKRAAQIATLRANGFKLARISDGVQENTCEDCHLWRGAIISLTGRAYRGYPALEKVVATTKLFHPNCIHHIEPYDESSSIRLSPIRASKSINAAIVEEGGKRKLAQFVLDRTKPYVSGEIVVGRVPTSIANKLLLVSRAKRHEQNIFGFDIVYEPFVRDGATMEARGLAHAWEGHGTPWNQRVPWKKKKKRFGERNKRNARALSFDELLNLPTQITDSSIVVYDGNKTGGGKGSMFIVDIVTKTKDGTLVQGFAIDEKEKKLRFITAFLKRNAARGSSKP